MVAPPPPRPAPQIRRRRTGPAPSAGHHRERPRLERRVGGEREVSEAPFPRASRTDAQQGGGGLRGPDAAFKPHAGRRLCRDGLSGGRGACARSQDGAAGPSAAKEGPPVGLFGGREESRSPPLCACASGAGPPGVRGAEDEAAVAAALGLRGAGPAVRGRGGAAPGGRAGGRRGRARRPGEVRGRGPPPGRLPPRAAPRQPGQGRRARPGPPGALQGSGPGSAAGGAAARRGGERDGGAGADAAPGAGLGPGALAAEAETFQQGKLFHAALEMLLLAEESPVKQQEEPSGVSGYLASVQHVLREVSGVRALESAVQHETLHYQGLVDCVAEYRGRLCVIDWKTSGKSKPLLRNTFDNPLQVVAYVGALNHDANYDFQVDCGLLVVAYKDGSPAHPHYMDPELCSHYWNKWLLRLKEFREKEGLRDDSRSEMDLGLV